MPLETIVGLGLGLLLGLAHSLEADHLAAIATVLAEPERRRGGWRVGTAWGMGHATMVIAAGVIFRMMRGAATERLEAGFELMVAVLLIALGAWRLGQGINGIHLHAHAHDDAAAPHRHVHLHLPFRRQGTHHHSHLPLYIGLLHGLAGSAAVMVMAPALLLESLGSYLAFLLLFGAGTMLGMALMAQAMSRGMDLVSRRPAVAGWIAGLAGTVSLTVGGAWAWRAAAAWM